MYCVAKRAKCTVLSSVVVEDGRSSSSTMCVVSRESNGDDDGPVLKGERCHPEGKRNAVINLTIYLIIIITSSERRCAHRVSIEIV